MWPFRSQPRQTRKKLRQANRALHQRDLPAAISLYRELLAEQPDNLTALLNLSAALHLSGQHSAAIEVLEQVLTLDPENATAHVNLGAAHGALGHLDRGVQALIRALEIAPTRKDIHYNLAALYLRKHDIANAMAELELELALRPDHQLAREALEELRRQYLSP